jgi:uncharacterized protein (DUF2141 family)
MCTPRRLPTVMLLLSCCMGGGARMTAEEITVEISNPPVTGEVVFVLFDSANSFGDLRDPVKTAAFPFDGRERYRLSGVSPGTYALLVYHDENRNGRVDRNFIGIPKEPLGFSNGYRPKGPPSYRRAAFVLAPGEQRDFSMALKKPLGPRGRNGRGHGVPGVGSGREPHRQQGPCDQGVRRAYLCVLSRATHRDRHGCGPGVREPRNDSHRVMGLSGCAMS